MSLPFAVQDQVRCRNSVWEVLKISDNNDGTWTVRLFPEDESKPKSFIYPHTPIELLTSTMSALEAGRLDSLDNYRLLTSTTRLSLVYE